jgi:hypothetical protein
MRAPIGPWTKQRPHLESQLPSFLPACECSNAVSIPSSGAKLSCACPKATVEESYAWDEGRGRSKPVGGLRSIVGSSRSCSIRSRGRHCCPTGGFVRQTRATVAPRSFIYRLHGESARHREAPACRLALCHPTTIPSATCRTNFSVRHVTLQRSGHQLCPLLDRHLSLSAARREEGRPTCLLSVIWVT